MWPCCPALSVTKIICAHRFCMGILKNVPTATKRLGWIARMANLRGRLGINCAGALDVDSMRRRAGPTEPPDRPH